MSARKGGDFTRNAGFTLVEVLVVIVILGTLAAIVTLTMRGLKDDGSASVCDFDRRAITDVVEVYLAENNVEVVPGATPQARIQSLVDAGLLKSASPNFVLAADGELTPIGMCAGG